ncbi:MAG TPA: phosphate acyltransferase PlsX, partial [Anaerolineae bacterium]|nr:phosphate acyltransferase PlsX [Anaerolineae bacterium]
GLPIEIVHAPQTIGMDEKPALAARQKKQSSLHIGLSLVKDGKADAFISAGNTGATLAIATLQTLKRIRGIKRPALATRYPTAGNPLLLDVGANVDVKPAYLQQFGLMGSLYMQRVAGIANPRVCIISNGAEAGKGNQLVRDSAELLAQLPINFIGGLEPDRFFAGGADVAVTDGFTGNIMLKATEGIVKALLTRLKSEILSSPRTKLGGLLARPAFAAVRQQLDPDTVGGAPLLGVNGVVIVAHGGSSPLAIKNAIGQARLAVQRGMIEAIKRGLGN